MWRHYVYLHRTSGGRPLYVGKGTFRKRDKTGTFERAHARHPRNRNWHEVVKAEGFSVEILAMCKTDTAAQEFEMAVIAEFGRRDLGLGPLVNVTDGGDGHAGIIASTDLRKKRSKNASRPRSEAWVRSIRIARNGGGNGGVVKLDDKLPDAWREGISCGKRGAKNPWFGKPTPIAKRVINIATGAIYDSVARAAAAEGIAVGTLYGYLDGSRPNKTSMMRLSDGVLLHHGRKEVLGR